MDQLRWRMLLAEPLCDMRLASQLQCCAEARQVHCMHESVAYNALPACTVACVLTAPCAHGHHRALRRKIGGTSQDFFKSWVEEEQVGTVMLDDAWRCLLMLLMLLMLVVLLWGCLLGAAKPHGGHAVAGQAAGNKAGAGVKC
jgi:hypothetical protein